MRILTCLAALAAMIPSVALAEPAQRDRGHETARGHQNDRQANWKMRKIVRKKAVRRNDVRDHRRNQERSRAAKCRKSEGRRAAPCRR